MRRALAVFAAILASVAGSCRKEPPAPPDPNRLVLELGGQGERLADALAKLRGEPHKAPQPDEQKPEAPKPDAPPRHVRLERGETVYALAQRELGDSKRWKEILEFNGWSE